MRNRPECFIPDCGRIERINRLLIIFLSGHQKREFLCEPFLLVIKGCQLSEVPRWRVASTGFAFRFDGFHKPFEE